MGPKRGPPRRPTVAPLGGSASQQTSVPESQDGGSHLAAGPSSSSGRSARLSTSPPVAETQPEEVLPEVPTSDVPQEEDIHQEVYRPRPRP